MEWLHLRIEIGWLKQTCRRLWENIPLYIYIVYQLYITWYILWFIWVVSNAEKQLGNNGTVSLKNDQVQGPRLQKLYLHHNHHTSISSGYIDLWVITNESQQSALLSQDSAKCEINSIGKAEIRKKLSFPFPSSSGGERKSRYSLTNRGRTAHKNGR